VTSSTQRGSLANDGERGRGRERHARSCTHDDASGDAGGRTATLAHAPGGHERTWERWSGLLGRHSRQWVAAVVAVEVPVAHSGATGHDGTP
jgi:hypothetical protein